MKNKYIKFLILFIATFVLTTSCTDDEIYIEHVAGISLDGVEGNVINIIENDTYEVKVKVNPENASNISEYTVFNYTSSNETIFTVNSTGEITALAPGEAILSVSAQADPSIKLSAMIKVSKRIYPVTSIEIGDLDKALFVEGMSIDLSDYITVKPENASNPELAITSSDENIAVLDKENKTLLKLLTSGKVTISIKTTDGTAIEKNIELNIISKDAEIEFVSLDRTNWKITPSHTPVSDTGIGGNKTEYLFDGSVTTGLSLYKPGKEGTPKEDTFGFTVELPTATPINTFKLTHRKFGYNRLSPYAIDLLGSNDGENFTVIQKGIPTIYVANSSDIEVTRILPFGNVTYKFIKVIYSDYDSANGNTVQVMEFELGTGTFK
ncbi:MAG: Ig-like domain-containing protein [Dysgonomonas sp.]